ncbi:MAG: DUF167 domain-containing protein [Methanomicrobiales archaeon]|jgi:uncharacterized protein (TIGR00251 family)
MNSFGDAVTESGTGVILAIEVSPSSGREKFISGYDPWRKSLRCAVRSPPVQGKANREVAESIARILGVPSSSVQVVSGATQSRKRVRIDGITREEVLERLGQFL